MAAERVPVEVWQAILRDSIAVPTFFNPDPVDECGLEAYVRHYVDEDGYWSAERTRNSLRRVCGTWNSYLKLFNHRYIRLIDIGKGIVPFKAITRATRIRYNQDDPSFQSLMAKLPALGQEYGEGISQWSLEIMDGEDKFFTETIIQNGKTPHLRCILNAEDIDLQHMGQYTPNLCFLDGLSATEASSNRVKISQLTTISILLPSIDPLLACELPSLRHLSVVFDGQSLHPNDMVTLLRAFGKGLITFFDNSAPSERSIPDEIWLLCPKLERFQSGLRWPTNPAIAPSLCYLRITGALYSSPPYPNSLHFPISSLKRAGISTVVFRDSWKRALEIYPAIIDYAMCVEDHGLVFQDTMGVQFHEFIVMLIQNRKKVHAGFMNFWNCNYCEF